MLRAPAANLVVRADLHPALVDLLLTVAQGVHREGDVVTPPGAYPSLTGAAFPLAAQAERFYLRGPPLLQRHMPF